MSLALFFQIVVLLLIAGLVAAFVVTIYQNGKDRSFAERTAAAGEVLKQIGASVADQKAKQTSSELEDLLKTLKEEKQKV